MEQVLARSTELPLELALCAVIVLGGYRLLYQRYRKGVISAALSAPPEPYATAQAVKILYEDWTERCVA